MKQQIRWQELWTRIEPRLEDVRARVGAAYPQVRSWLELSCGRPLEVNLAPVTWVALSEHFWFHAMVEFSWPERFDLQSPADIAISAHSDRHRLRLTASVADGVHQGVDEAPTVELPLAAGADALNDMIERWMPQLEALLERAPACIIATIAAGPRPEDDR